MAHAAGNSNSSPFKGSLGGPLAATSRAEARDLGEAVHIAIVCPSKLFWDSLFSPFVFQVSTCWSSSPIAGSYRGESDWQSPCSVHD